MSQAIALSTTDAALPLAAMHCLRHAASEDHSRANCLRRRGRQTGRHSARRTRLQYAGALIEATARALAAEVRA